MHPAVQLAMSVEDMLVVCVFPHICVFQLQAMIPPVTPMIRLEWHLPSASAVENAAAKAMR